ncbi:MAG: GGDEF domain-containing protein [Omnitrophica bacterium]|nr:GGDEF domain-containing protein [Candidatus Omnitrophota bacterium]
MHLLNLFIIPLILISLNFKLKFSYVISLLCSLTAATFIYTEQLTANILFTIAIFNLVPLVGQRFSLNLRNKQLSLGAKKSLLKAACAQRRRERDLTRQSNTQLANKVAQIVELYQMGRDMSSVLKTEGIFEILAKKLAGHFRFERCRLILIDEQAQGLEVEKVFELKYDQSYVRQVDTGSADSQILKQSLDAEKIAYIEEESKVLAPLMAEGKFLGALTVEDLSVRALGNFSILVDQFALEFERVRLYQKIQKLAITDGLTELFVRRYFLERLEEEIERSACHHLELAFLMIDIDHFKRCNDNFGHLTGDAVLKEIGARIKASVREIDLAGRFGGEEFSVLLPDTDKEGAYQAAERIRLNIAEHRFKAYDQPINVQISAGVALYPRDSTSLQGLIDKADQALYRAKQEGRNRICLFN